MSRSKNLRQRIYDEINEINHEEGPYTDDYDGFTHQSYEGLVNDVIETLDNEGYDLSKPIPEGVIHEITFQLIG